MLKYCKLAQKGMAQKILDLCCEVSSWAIFFSARPGLLAKMAQVVLKASGKAYSSQLHKNLYYHLLPSLRVIFVSLYP